MCFRNYGLRKIWLEKCLSFRRPSEKKYGKWDQTLLKYEQQHLYHIY